MSLGAWLHHLPVVPIAVPMGAAALMLLFPEHRRGPRLAIAVGASLVQLAVAFAMLVLTTDAAPRFWPEGIGVYAIGGWSAPFGIVLVVDRLSALMLSLNAVLGLAVVLHSTARWDRIGVHYQPLLQFLLLGLNGAFLTGDLFNLFVFFEILLAASYALLLHGGGVQRVKMALHFIVVNLVAAFAFLLGVAMLYSVLGTLNMADIAARWNTLADADRGLAGTGAAVLTIAFLIKAGSWPLNFWLPGTYSTAATPVAAAFAISTKVGIYAILRLSSLVETPGAFGEGWLFTLAVATMLFGIVGMLAARQLPRLIAFTVILSSGTLLGAAGLGSPAMVAPALFYLVGSVMASGAFFMLAGMTERMRTASAEAASEEQQPSPSYSAFAVGEPPAPRPPDEEVGIAIPAAMAFLGLNFVCCTLLVTGLPPLSGFVAKVALAAAAIDAAAVSGTGHWQAWTLIGLLLLGGFVGMIALARAGMRLFWSVTDRNTPRLRVVEAAPLAFLILVCLGLTAGAGPAMRYFQAAAEGLNRPDAYIRAVLGSLPPEAAP